MLSTAGLLGVAGLLVDGFLSAGLISAFGRLDVVLVGLETEPEVEAGLLGVRSTDLVFESDDFDTDELDFDGDEL